MGESVKTRIPAEGLLFDQRLLEAYVVCWRRVRTHRTKEMDLVRKLDQVCLFGCPRRKLEVVPREMNIGFEFSVKK